MFVPEKENNGPVKFLSELAIVFAWLVIGSAVLSRLRFSHSLLGLAVYTVWGTLGIVLFLKNAFHAPIGLIAVMGTGLYYGARGVHGEVGNYASILLVFFSWLLCLWLPYGFMAWRGHREKDELRFCNGLAGLGAVNFFMIGLFLLGYIGRGV